MSVNCAQAAVALQTRPSGCHTLSQLKKEKKKRKNKWEEVVGKERKDLLSAPFVIASV